MESDNIALLKSMAGTPAKVRRNIVRATSFSEARANTVKSIAVPLIPSRPSKLQRTDSGDPIPDRLIDTRDSFIQTQAKTERGICDATDREFKRLIKAVS